MIPRVSILSDRFTNIPMSTPQREGLSSGPSSTRHSKEGNPHSLVQPMQVQEYIRVADHDVLSGRGVYIAQHAGNERFRALVFSRHDVNYCHAYTTSEKRALAEEIYGHIKSLNPPGRFLRRCGRTSRTIRGLDGPWEELSKDEAIKKACQALRDCNRQDRTGYAASVSVPEDVSASKQARSVLGLTNKQLAEMAAAQVKHRDDLQDRTYAAIGSPFNVDVQTNHPHQHHAVMSSQDNPFEPNPIGDVTSNSANLLWYMKQNVAVGNSASRIPMPVATPTTAGSSGSFGTLPDEHHHDGSGQSHIVHHRRVIDDYSPVATDAMRILLSAQCDPSDEGNCEPQNPHRISTSTGVCAQDQDFDDDFSTHFDEDDVISHMVQDIHKHPQDHNIDATYHITAEAAVTAAMECAVSGGNVLGSTVDASHHGHDFGPPSPLHLHDHNDDDTF